MKISPSRTALPLALALLAVTPAAAQEQATRVVDLTPSLRETAAKLQVQRIEAFDDRGPRIGAVMIHADDLQAQVANAARSGLPLAGYTVMVKDNIETREWATTAGSLALVDNMTARDAPIVARLRAAGAVIAGKTNLSEWANFRSSDSTSGWSAVGGQTRNPHAPFRNACGSSSGSAAAVAALMTSFALGTETDGSITCPASVNGVVGFKPTLGLVSRTHIVPLSHSQDTAGPITQTVKDAARVLTAIAGSDPLDPATAAADTYKVDYAKGLDAAALEGLRIGVMRKQVGEREDVAQLFEAALADMEKAGAVLVEVDYEPQDEMYEDEFTVLLYEFREDLGAYLRASPADIPVRSLADVIRFNKAHADTELRWFGQDLMEQAQGTVDQQAYEEARADSLRMAKDEGVDRLLAEYEVDILVAPTMGPAWSTDLIYGDNFEGDIGIGSIAAIGGTPHLTVPMGTVEKLPVGLSFMGPKWADLDVLKAGAAYEKVRSAELATVRFASDPRFLEKVMRPAGD
ncbi:amidase [Croceicoccus gelatinilyticus]|uniref:amidase n=1 Tax=Croceicoccus gelatinilyticus TaxID=2835536 RepID=UPI001BCBCCCA|nr:amidase [Croceicoccus gelatinilyticus]MBS7669257.1 amidase [Croceicoccus gelatinilyticus]